MAQKIPLSNSTRFIYILHNESYYILRYLNCSPHLLVLPSSCEHKSFLILDKVASVTKVSSERIVTSSTMFLLLLLGSGLSLSNAAAAEPTAELTVYYEALCGDSIKFLFSFSPSLRTFNHLYIYNNYSIFLCTQFCDNTTDTSLGDVRGRPCYQLQAFWES